ncbi:PD-(D/E)XK nuclease superfamily protein [Anatilimnocola aggregata]|uniref:PD-(D/E)XK nuclease superfamily protein n=1 Tax=Anatilimnocola aggregata TaxID=2528021 RepID=A0A517YKC6_9BACT|nr:PD-(D/E)XK nuclease family protein [Anatilimnocola aggregata]QDU30681.1 PD-(D/E)XK nuclease superfamily protein [Anatilimnocola aggregata]
MNIDEVQREESSGKPDAWKLARPVWGWGRGEIPRPTPPSRSRWSAEQVEESTEQLLLYSELAADFAPGKPVRIEFAVLTKTKTVAIEQHSVAVQRAPVDRMKRVVERVWNAINSEHFYPAPSPLACGGCPFRDPCRKWPG